MKNTGAWSRILWICVVVSLGSLTHVQAQEIFRDVDQVKRDVSDLKNEVNELKNQFYWLRKAVLKSAATEDQPSSQPAASQQQKTEKQDAALDEKQLTAVICKAVGKFFAEVDAALRMTDAEDAGARMRNAFGDLNSVLQGQRALHRVSKLLDIYEGLAWDTYVAVQLSGSVQGNQDFLAALNKHKRKFADTCP
jgi:hypothetical protein